MQLDIGKLLCNMLTLLTSRAVFGSYRPAPMATSWQLGEIRHVSLGGKPRLWRVAGWWKSGELWSFMGCEHVWWRYMYIYIYFLYIYIMYIYIYMHVLYICIGFNFSLGQDGWFLQYHCHRPAFLCGCSKKQTRQIALLMRRMMTNRKILVYAISRHTNT